MFTYVSWKEYLLVVVILLVVYYVCLGLKYYREEIKALLAGKLPQKLTGESKAGQADSSDVDSSEMEELEYVTNDLRYAIFEKAGKQIGKSDLLQLLEDRLADYNGLYKPAFRVAINNYIIQHAKEICGVTYHEHELNSAWDRL